MDAFLTIDLNLFSFMFCVGMYIMNLRLSEKTMIQNRLFRLLIVITMTLLFLESLSWIVDGMPGAVARVLNVFSNTAGFIFAPFPATVWAFYASYQLFHDVNRLRLEMRLMTIPICINAILAVATPFTGLFFRIDDANFYHREPFVAISATISFLPLLYTAISYIVFRKRMPRSMLVPMLLFALPPVIATVFQTLFYGISVIWSAITLSVFIVHTGIHNRQFYLDHLTGVYNRRQLDNRLGDLLQTGRRRTDFACIMLDIDNFKSINDSFGHVSGDEALKNAAVILKSCVRSSDFVARFAGDEFVILLETNDEQAVRRTIRRILDKAAQFNRDALAPYRLEFSVGFDICRCGMGITREALIARVDAQMYRDKKHRRAHSADSLMTDHMIVT